MNRVHRGAFVAAALLVAFSGIAAAQNVPLDDRFKYQGELRNAGVVVDGVVDLQLSIFDQPTFGNQVGTTQTVLGVVVSRGVFEVDVPFSALSFAGDKRHLQVAVRSPAGAGVYTTLNPRIELVPAPNAHYARVAALAFGANAVGGIGLGGLVQKAEAGSITVGMLAVGAVNSAAILDGSITGADLAPNTITAANIAAGTITGTEIASNTINSGDIQNGAVNNVDLAADSVDSSKILDGSITSVDLAPGALDGGDAGTLDGVDSTQFFRLDSNNVITGDFFTINSGAPNVFTFGGANLDLRLGDTALDEVSTSGNFAVGGNTHLGDHPIDSTTVSGSLTVNGGAVVVSNLTGQGTLSASNTLRLDAPFVNTSANVILEGSGVGGSGYLIFGDGNAEKRIQLNGVNPVLTIDGTIGQSATVVIGDQLVVEGGLEAISGAFDTSVRLGAAEGDSNIYFYDQGSQTANRIRWVDSTTLSCGPFGQFDSYFGWRISDSTNTGWILADGSDNEVYIDETGNVVIDGALTQSSGCDLAEMFFSTGRLEPGTVVAIDPGAPEHVVASTRALEYGLAGVVSENPGVILNGPPADALPFVAERNEVERALAANPESPELEQRFLELERMLDSWPRGDIPVALAGRVPVKVIGAVAVGDPLTSSDVVGHAMAMTRPGPAIGIAMESKSSTGPGRVLMLVQPGFHAPRGFAASLGAVSRESVAEIAPEEDGDLKTRIETLEQKLTAALSGRGSEAERTLTDTRPGELSISPPAPNGDADGVDARGESPAATIVQIRKEAWGDYDSDGKDDVFVVNPGSSSKLYRNLGDGTFQDVTGNAGIVANHGIRIALWQDYDVDRVLDLLLVDGDGVAKLYQGLGHGRFQDVTEPLRLDFGQPIVDAEWIDHDRDGKPDLKVSIADGRLLLHHNLGGGSFRTSELRSAMAITDESARRISTLEAENAAIHAQLAELEALITTLAVERGAKR
jgi:hypothetical protein